MNHIKHSALTLGIFVIAALFSGILADWTSGAHPSTFEWVDSALGAIAFAIAFIIIVAIPTALICFRLSLQTNPIKMAMVGSIVSGISMAVMIFLVDGLPFYIPYDLIIILALSAAGALSGYLWARDQLKLSTRNA